MSEQPQFDFTALINQILPIVIAVVSITLVISLVKEFKDLV